MIVHVDTSALVDALTGPRRSLDALIRLTEHGHRLEVSAIVHYEWARGPRTRAELLVQEELFPADRAVPFGPAEAAIAARLHTRARRARGREIDLAVAACALAANASLWTLNAEDFGDIEGLTLV